MKIILFQSLLILLFVGCAPLPNVSTKLPAIEGKITKDGKPLSNAKILFSHSSSFECGEVEYSTTSDKNGLFSLPSDKEFNFFVYMGDSIYILSMCVVVGEKRYLGYMYNKHRPPDTIKLECEIRKDSLEIEDLFNVKEAHSNQLCNT